MLHVSEQHNSFGSEWTALNVQFVPRQAMGIIVQMNSGFVNRLNANTCREVFPQTCKLTRGERGDVYEL